MYLVRVDSSACLPVPFTNAMFFSYPQVVLEMLSKGEMVRGTLH